MTTTILRFPGQNRCGPGKQLFLDYYSGIWIDTRYILLIPAADGVEVRGLAISRSVTFRISRWVYFAGILLAFLKPSQVRWRHEDSGTGGKPPAAQYLTFCAWGKVVSSQYVVRCKTPAPPVALVTNFRCTSGEWAGQVGGFDP